MAIPWLVMGDEKQGPQPADFEAPSDWPVVHRAAQVAWRYRDIAYAHVDRPNPDAVAAARAELLNALAATEAEPRCVKCHFWEAVPDEDGHVLGLCRRYPPSYEGWPTTEGSAWCGEYRLRP
ncbi:MAG: hypothetical protein K2W86_00480 [Sphingomonas sp.]|uniref:hypothetical protein n=1 Tax=Sphingomonas sp. TaxID=28214 RepID=UPI0035A90D6F|nr:hypothetical protein [Sphingomonas sp.]